MAKSSKWEHQTILIFGKTIELKVANRWYMGTVIDIIKKLDSFDDIFLQTEKWMRQHFDLYILYKRKNLNHYILTFYDNSQDSFSYKPTDIDITSEVLGMIKEKMC